MFCLFMQKPPPNKGVFAILYQIWTLNRFELRLSSQLWQKLPIFLENRHFQIQKIFKKDPFSSFFLKKKNSCIFRPLYKKRLSCVVLKKKKKKKKTSLHVFLFMHVYTYISECPPGHLLLRACIQFLKVFRCSFSLVCLLNQFESLTNSRSPNFPLY